MTTPLPPTPTPPPIPPADDSWDEHPNDPANDPLYSAAQFLSDRRDLHILAYWWLAWSFLSLFAAIGGCLIAITSPLFWLGGTLPIAQQWLLGSFCWGGVFALVQVPASLFVVQGLRQREGLLRCRILASLTCLIFPLGTLLGFFTLRLLHRPSVARSFV